MPLRVEVVLMSKPYAKVTFRGRRMDRITRAALKAVEKELGYQLTITQGSYNAGAVSASAGTHDGGGVVDLAWWDWENKVKALRKHGFAAWPRPYIPGLWPSHIHAVLIGHDRLAPSAARQVVAYLDRRDGLKSNAIDNFWRPDKIVEFKYPARSKPVHPNHVTRARDALVEATVKLQIAAVELDQTPEDRDAAQKGADRTVELVKDIEALLERLPKR